MARLSVTEKCLLLKEEFSLLYGDVNDGYKSIRAKASILIAIYTFTLPGYMSALSHWGQFRSWAEYFIILEVLLLVPSIIYVAIALFKTKKNKWKSLGDPKLSFQHLSEKDTTLESYYEKRVVGWHEAIHNNQQINQSIDILLLRSFQLLMANVIIVTLHVCLAVYT